MKPNAWVVTCVRWSARSISASRWFAWKRGHQRRPGMSGRVGLIMPCSRAGPDSERTFDLYTMSKILIQNGTVVNADTTVRADLLIDGGVIKEVRPSIPPNSAATIVDATG